MQFKVTVHYSIPKTKEYDIEAEGPAEARGLAIEKAYSEKLPGEVYTGQHACEMLVDGKWVNEVEGQTVLRAP